jgi:heme exporter protein C
MWWKLLSIVLVAYTLSAGLLVPLKPGIVKLSPEAGSTNSDLNIQFYGYNSHYTRSDAKDIRVWLEFDSTHTLLGSDLKVINDTILSAHFVVPGALPKGRRSAMLNAIIDHPENGVSLLPDAIEISKKDTLPVGSADSMWLIAANQITDLHIKSDFSYPYRNVIYETIRNTYYHVPMWFVMFLLLTASAWYSIQFLRFSGPNRIPKPGQISLMECDRRAIAFAEGGILFGLLGLFTGMLWAHYAWGAAWSNDIKQLMTAVALLIYIAYFILRKSFDEQEKGARLGAVYNIFAFASLIPLLYVVPRMFASLHPGATGNPAFSTQDLDNTMKLVFRPGSLGWILLGFWMAQLRYRIQRISDKVEEID